MSNKTRRCAMSFIAVVMASQFSITAGAAAANMPGGRLTGQISEDLYIAPSDITTMNNFYNSLRDENIESTGSSIHKVANFDDIRTAGGSDYSENGVAYYDMNNGRGVSFTKLTGTNSIYGSISDIFGVNGQYDKDSVIPSQVRAAYTNFQTLQSNQSYIVPETSKESITDFLSALGEYFHFLPHHPYDNLTYSTYLNPNGITSLIGGTIPQTQYNGYRAEFESEDIRKLPILNNGVLTEEGLKMVNGRKTFLAGNEDNPYGDLFQAARDDYGNLDNSKIIEDSYILIRRLLGVDNQDKNGLLSAKTMSTVTTVNSTPWLNSVYASAINIKSEYEYNRNDFTDGQVNKALAWLDQRRKTEPKCPTSGYDYSWKETGVNPITGHSYADGVNYKIRYYVSYGTHGSYYTNVQTYDNAWNVWWNNTLDGLLYYYEMLADDDNYFSYRAKNYSELLADDEEYQEILDELPDATDAYYDAISRFNDDAEEYWVNSIKALFPNAAAFDKYCFKSNYTKQYYAQCMCRDRWGNTRKVGNRTAIDLSYGNRYNRYDEEEDSRNRYDDYYYYDITYEYQFTFESTSPAQDFIDAGGSYDEFLASFYSRGGATGESRSLSLFYNLSFWNNGGGYSGLYGNYGSMHYSDQYSSSSWLEDAEKIQEAFNTAYNNVTNRYNPDRINISTISDELKAKLQQISENAPAISDEEYHQYQDYKDLTNKKKQLENKNKSLSYQSMNGAKYIGDIETIINQLQGVFQRKARNDYDSDHPDDYQQYKNAVDLFDVSGYNINFDYQKYSDDDIEQANFTSADGIDALLWYLWVSEGRDEIPKDCHISTIEDWIGDKDYSDKVLTFRKWLINNELYINESYTAGHKYTLDPEIWDNGKLLELWAAVYYIPASENIGKCLDTLNYSDELQNIADSIEANAGGTEYNKIDPTFYPYLKGYTNASFVPDNSVAYEKNIGKHKVTVIKSTVADYSLYDNAMAFFHKLGMDTEEKSNIPLDKHMNLGFYKDVEVTGYSNNYVQTDGILGRYEWYVYFDESGSRGNAEVVYHNTTTTLECPFTAIQEGTYWIDCYQSGYTTYEERMRYTSTYFLTEETTHTILMSSLTPDIQVLLDSKTVAEKIKLKTDEEGYVVSDSAMQWRAAGDRVVVNFSTQRVSDIGDINLG